ncbi:hypothetical protein M1563_00770 [Patescibacteria group bacterium]|nr:hypothetical protein [Patescibacteria group bacterium]MCL5410148.1 hypothetical protein [Patescibacteria group bacterium]
MNKRLHRWALTGGLIWGAIMFLTTLACAYTGYGRAFLDIWVSIYPGFNISLWGSLIGFVYGFLDLYVGIYIIAWVAKQVSKGKKTYS